MPPATARGDRGRLDRDRSRLGTSRLLGDDGRSRWSRPLDDVRKQLPCLLCKDGIAERQLGADRPQVSRVALRAVVHPDSLTSPSACRGEWWSN
jgi:hypothetical protein